ncbi:MAG: family 20 glycosylhydrolase [Gemmatimonadota bacterium]|nr:MAG: family 20 glycosylhydrolase [Gemmatimonadota bacterium]
MTNRLICFYLLAVAVACRSDVSEYHVIPFPASISHRSGQFVLDENTAVVVSDPTDEELMRLARYAAEMMGIQLGTAVDIDTQPAVAGSDNTIGFFLTEEDDRSEAYRLAVDSEAVKLESGSPAGLFYGLHTLRQLPQEASERSALHGEGGTWFIPAVEIEDSPRFTYRGMHLDVGRHFMPVDFIKRYIDLMAMYKMNTFHWHLTEDQGWRIEIKKYPRLTEVGAFRRETILEQNFEPYVGDSTPHGGFYTQEEIRELVAYASERYVTIIPEIEMPGHSIAALASYPELACTEGPFEVATVWGIHEDIYCPSEETFSFLEDVLTEVMDLFPSRYIHIGGDEAPKVRWEESPLAQEVIRSEGLADEHELQSYFIRRIEEFLTAHGRRLIGWDEILEGGLAPDATVMSWRGTAGGIEAAKLGHDVIMTPTSHVYFDYYQGDPDHEPLAIGGYTPLEQVYSFEPVPGELSRSESRHVLGAQGNVWTEYMKTADYVEYMVFPRLLALSEVVWSPRQRRNWDSFVPRLQSQLRWLDRFDVNYRVPHVTGLESDVLTLEDHVTIELSTLLPAAEIRYTADGSPVTASSTLYAGPIELAVTEQGVTVKARAFLPSGRSSPPGSARFSKTSLRPAVPVQSSELAAGLKYRYYEDDVASIRELSDLTPIREGVTSDVGSQQGVRDQHFGLWFEGYIRVPESGVYTFYLTSDDGSGLTIGDQSVVVNDGLHGLVGESGMVALEEGYHPITVLYFQAGGGMGLQLRVRGPGEEQQHDPREWLFHTP